MNVTKIGSFEAIALLLIVSINHLLLNMPQTIIDTCGSASLLNTVYTTILAFIIAYLILFLLFKKFPSCDILDVSNYLGGKVLKNIIGILCEIYMLTLSSVFLRNFAEGLKLIYFFDAPITYILMFFLFVCAIANYFGPKAIIRTNLFIVPIVLISIVIVFIFSMFILGLITVFIDSGSSCIFLYSSFTFVSFVRFFVFSIYCCWSIIEIVMLSIVISCGIPF